VRVGANVAVWVACGEGEAVIVGNGVAATILGVSVTVGASASLRDFVGVGLMPCNLAMAATPMTTRHMSATATTPPMAHDAHAGRRD
jgi:hypothetical protein